MLVVSTPLINVGDMEKFNPAKMLSFDLETTGVDPAVARIVTSSLIKIEGSNKETTDLLADPGIEIPKAASDVHGITTEYAREHGAPHDAVVAETVERIYKGWEHGFTLIVYNAPYDLSVLNALTGGDFLVRGGVVDPFVIDRAKDPYRKGARKLESVSAHYGVSLENAHESQSDALAAARIAWKLSRIYPELTEMPMEELMEAQASWHYNKQISFKKYLEGKGEDTSNISTAWPMRGIK